MSNSTSDQKLYKAVAVTAIGHAFIAVEHIGQTDMIGDWLVPKNTTDWNFVRNVNFHNSTVFP